MCAPLVLSGHPLTAWRPARMLSARPRTRWVRNDLGQRVQLVRGEGLGVSDQSEGRKGGGGGFRIRIRGKGIGKRTHAIIIPFVCIWGSIP